MSSSESLYVLPKWEKFLAIKHTLAIPLAKSSYFVSIIFQESVIKLAVIRKKHM